MGEDLVTQWLQSTGWSILHRRFSSRWGEIDIIAQLDEKQLDNETNLLVNQLPPIAFIEVKTRSQRNWDLGGKGAITPQKQAKIWQTATIFLAQYPEKTHYPCRFDVALVYYQPISKQPTQLTWTPPPLASLSADGYQFDLQEYLPAAFD